MLHLAKFKIRENFYRPYNVQCSCGVGGEFLTQDEARSWMQTRHFAGLTGDSTFAFADDKKLPDVKPAERQVPFVPKQPDDPKKIAPLPTPFPPTPPKPPVPTPAPAPAPKPATAPVPAPPKKAGD
jgi:hypothetical protein